MPTISCEFVFYRASAIYYSGEQVIGNVVLTTVKDIRVEELQLNCRGVANVSWHVHERHSSSIQHNDGAYENQQQHYQGHEIYVDETRSLHKQSIIYAGRHEYKFSFYLPIKCPATSGSHKFGEIFYCVSLLLKRCTKHDKQFKQRFVVKNRLELNAVGSTCMTPALQSHYLKSIDTKIEFSTPQTDYVPGQSIKFRLDIATTAADILRNLRCKVRLCQKNIFQCQQPSAGSREIVKKLDKVILRFANQKRVTNSLEGSLQLPLLTPLTSPHQQPIAIISTSFYLDALVCTKNKLPLAELCIPITVGSEALRNNRDSPCELPLFCYENIEVADTHTDSLLNDSASMIKSVPYDKLPYTPSFIHNYINDQCNNKNVYLPDYSGSLCLY